MRDWPKRRRPACRSTFPRFTLPSALLLLTVGVSSAFPTHPGKWTGTMNWQSTAINMVLLPGDSTHHSRVLWWNHDDHGPVGGGLWGWSPGADDSVNFGTFPLSHFVDLDLDDPVLHSGQPNNIFCAGQTMLEDGRLLITGGTALGEGGSRAVAVFDPRTDANGTWRSADSMEFRRWYSDNTLLPDGRVVTVTGSSFSHYAVVGGIVDAPTDTATRMLQRYEVSFDDTFETSVVPTSPSVPLAAFSDASTAELTSSSILLFGGKDAGGDVRGSSIQIQRDRNAYAADYWFKQVDLGPASGQAAPSPRVGAALASFAGGTQVLLIGGKTASGTILSEIWRGRISNGTIKWWVVDNQTEVALPALHGASATYAEGVNRVFLFGGSNTASDTATSLDVYSLQLGENLDTAKVYVSKVEVGGVVTSDRPGPRSYGSLTYFKNKVHHGGTEHTRAMLFGGKTAGGSYSDTLTSLWIFGPTSLLWERDTTGARPSGRARFGAAIDPNSQWLVISGGETAANTSSNELWAYDLTCGPSGCTRNGHWERLHDLPKGVRGHAAGVIGPEPAFPRLPEVFNPADSSWTTLDNSPHWQEWFSFGFAAPRVPGGDSLRVFYAGPEDPSSMLHLSRATPNWTTIGSNIGDWRAGSAVMYRPGKVMKCGTRDTGGNTPESVLGRTAVIDLKASSPAWTVAATADSMIHRRNHNLVILPNGEVLVVGGARWGGNDVSNNDNCVKRPQIWNPDTLAAGHWYGEEPSGIPLDPSTVRRHYHTSAILLPDARVLVAGGNEAVETSQQTQADIYSPYYLFNGTRPVIMNAPARVSYGERFVLRMGPNDTQIAKVTLVRPGATTHGFDQNQRYVSLTFSAMNQQVSGERRYLTTAPSDSFDAPPGDYLLFALNAAGTPAIARWIQVRATNLDATAPNTVTDLVKVCSHGTWAELQWSTPQGDGGAEIKTPIQTYDIRFSQSAMPTLNDFLVADPPAYTPSPQLDPDASSTATTSVYNLTPETRYYFRFRIKDFQSGSTNWSGLSNTLSFITHDESCGGSGGGGGCCYEEGLAANLGGNAFMQVGTGGTSTTDPTFLENTLLANTPLNVTSTDVVRLSYGPKWTSTGSRIRLSQSGALSTRYTGVRLLGVTPTAGEELFVAGHDVVSGTRINPIRISQAGGRDLTARFAADSAFDGRDGDTLVVDFADRRPGRIALQTSRSQLVIPPDRTGIDIQCETAQGWSTVAHHDPRELVSQALYDVASPGRVRLVFLGEHRLHRVERFVPGKVPTVMALEPTSIEHSRSGDVSTALGTGGVLLASGEHAHADFAATLDDAAGREWFLQVTGEHVATSAAGNEASLRDAESEAAPLKYALEQNRPNPFAITTRVGFELPVRTKVKLEVFDLMGRRVATLADAMYEPGRYSVSWDRVGNNGTRLPAGIYTCRFTTREYQEHKRMIVLP